MARKWWVLNRIYRKWCAFRHVKGVKMWCKEKFTNWSNCFDVFECFTSSLAIDLSTVLSAVAQKYLDEEMKLYNWTNFWTLMGYVQVVYKCTRWWVYIENIQSPKGKWLARINRYLAKTYCNCWKANHLFCSIWGSTTASTAW